MSQPWCPDSGKIVKYAAGKRVRCTRCGRRVPVVAWKLHPHRVPGAAPQKVPA